MFIKFVFKISMEFSIVSSWKLQWWSLLYDYKKCISLTFQSQKSSKVNRVFIVPFLPAFYQVLVTFFFGCVCMFFTFLFSWVCFSWKKTNGKCEEGCLWTWQEQFSTVACFHANSFACVCFRMDTNVYFCVSIYLWVDLFMSTYVCMSV